MEQYFDYICNIVALRFVEMKKITFLLIIIFFAACKKNDPESEEEELITTIELSFTANGSTQKFTWKDTDGTGGANPVIDKISLAANQIYSLTVRFLNESISPIEDITTEIQGESDEHLIVITPSPTPLLTYTYEDKDVNNLPVGLVGEIKTNGAGTGKLKVQLRHQPPVNGKNVKDGTTTPGSDDVNVDFDVEIL